MPPSRSIQIARAVADHAVDQVDADVLVDLQRLGRAEHHHGGEHVPLRFEERVGVVAVPVDQDLDAAEEMEIAAERDQAR